MPYVFVSRAILKTIQIIVIHVRGTCACFSCNAMQMNCLDNQLPSWYTRVDRARSQAEQTTWSKYNWRSVKCDLRCL